MDIQIRKATEQDLPKVFKLVKEFASFLEKTDKVHTSVDDFIKNQEYYSCFLAENMKGETMGYALFSTMFHTWSGKSIYLDDLFVKDEYRRCSIGTMLICSLIDYAKSQDVNNLNWQVLEWNKTAINFYKKLGANVGDDNMNCYYTIK